MHDSDKSLRHDQTESQTTVYFTKSIVRGRKMRLTVQRHKLSQQEIQK